MDLKIIEQYLKVKALADSGSPGERDAARAILAKLEQKNPGVRAASEAYLRSQQAAKAAAESPDPFPGARRSGSAGPVPGANPGNWENIFRYASGFYETVKEVVEDISDAYYGKVLVEQEIEFSANHRERNVYIRIKVPFETILEARRLNKLQKDSFREEMHAQLEAYVDGLLEEKKSEAPSTKKR